MRNNKSFLHCTAIAAIMLVFTACSNDENFSEQTNVPETIAPVVKGHPLVISASIGVGHRLVCLVLKQLMVLNWNGK